MKSELEKAFDKELRKESFKRRILWLLIPAGLVLVLAIYTPVFSEKVYGETTAITVKERGHDKKAQLKVRLDSGKEVVILVGNSAEHLEGKRLELSKMTSVVGMASYQFIQYVD